MLHLSVDIFPGHCDRYACGDRNPAGVLNICVPPAPYLEEEGTKRV